MTDVVQRLDMELLRRLQAEVDGLRDDVTLMRKELAFLRAECVELVLNDVRRIFEQLPERIRYRMAVMEQRDKARTKIGLVREKAE